MKTGFTSLIAVTRVELRAGYGALRYREHLVERGLSASTINVQLSAIRKLVEEARRQGIIDSESAASLTDVPNIKQQGNWLTRAQAKELLGVPDRERLIGKRDHA